MRILRLDLGSGRSVDLHPFLTVLPELGDDDRDEVLEAIRSLARGSTAGVRGLVQNQGLLVELDGLDHDWRPVVTGANVVIDGLTDGTDDLTWLRAQIDQQQRRAEIEAVIVEEIRADLDPSARARVATIEALLAPVDHHVAHRRQVRIERVQEALARVLAVDQFIVESPPGVDDLCDRWASNASRLAEANAHLEGLREAIDRAEARLVQARATLVEAEEAAKPVLLTRDEEARLETLAFPGMDSSRRGKWRKTLRREEEEEMEALLTKVGVESWTAYTVYRTAPTAPQHRLDAEAAARAGVDDAEHHLAEMQEALANDRIYAQLSNESEQIREEARGFLGLMLPSDIGRALEQLTIERENPEWSETVDALTAMLNDFDGETGQGPAGDEGQGATHQTIVRAQAWLSAQEEADAPIDVDSLHAELETARTVLARHQRALSRISLAESSAVEAALRLAQLQEQLSARMGEQVDTADGLLAFVEPIATQVAIEAKGSLAVAVVGQFDLLADHDVEQLMARLSEISQTLQIVVVSDRHAAADWTRAVGLDRAMISRPRDGVAVGP